MATNQFFQNMSYPLVVTNIAIENGYRNSWFTQRKMVIFNSYVSLPEGMLVMFVDMCELAVTVG